MHELYEKFIENLVETLTGRERLGDPHGRLEDNISKDVKGAAYEGVD
jgi:hypothetical protein